MVDCGDTKVFVKYILTEKCRSTIIEKYIENYYYEEEFLNKKDQCIFITKSKLKFEGNLENYMLNMYNKDKIFFQVFWLNTLLYDITENRLVPKYKILSDEGKQELIQKYNIAKETLLPNVILNDPLAMIYGVKLNEIVKITYPSRTNGLTTFYRLCKLSI